MGIIASSGAVSSLLLTCILEAGSSRWWLKCLGYCHPCESFRPQAVALSLSLLLLALGEWIRTWDFSLSLKKMLLKNKANKTQKLRHTKHKIPYFQTLNLGDLKGLSWIALNTPKVVLTVSGLGKWFLETVTCVLLLGQQLLCAFAQNVAIHGSHLAYGEKRFPSLSVPVDN